MLQRYLGTQREILPERPARLADWLFLGGVAEAKDGAALWRLGITASVNCPRIGY